VYLRLVKDIYYTEHGKLRGPYAEHTLTAERYNHHNEKMRVGAYVRKTDS
jgi:hypothetical protein